MSAVVVVEEVVELVAEENSVTLSLEEVAVALEVGQLGPIGPPGAGAPIQEEPVGAIDGVNTVFTTSQAFELGKIEVFLNGVVQRFPDHYTETSTTTIEFTVPPTVGDHVWVVYSIEGSGEVDQPITLDDLTDVDTVTTPPNEGDVLTFQSPLWVPGAPSGGGGGGSGIELGTYQIEDYAAVSQKHYDLSGSPGSVSLGALVVASPNDWIDADANILTPGIYNIVVHLGWTDDPGDGWIYPPTLFNSAQGYAYQAIFAKQALGGDFVTAPDPQALGPDDVPYGLGGVIRFSASVALPTDFTLQIDVYRMAYPE